MSYDKNSKSGASTLTLTEDHIQSVLLVRRARADLLGADIFSDPAWDILLELYGARLGERSVSSVDLARAIGTPVSTTIRWIASLNSHGLTEFVPEPTESSRLSVRLTQTGAARMEQLASKWASAFVTI